MMTYYNQNVIVRGDGSIIFYEPMARGYGRNKSEPLVLPPPPPRDRQAEAHHGAVQTLTRTEPGIHYFTPQEYRYMKEYWNTSTNPKQLIVDMAIVDGPVRYPTESSKV